MNPFRAALLIVLLLSSSASAKTTRFVWTNSPAPAAPYTNWTTAAHILQDAVDVCANGDTVVVTNGLYAVGGRPAPGKALANRVLVTNDIALISVNGPKETVIQGAGPLGPAAVRCAYLTNGAVLSGFRLENGHTLAAGGGDSTPDQHGGGLYAYNAGLATNCIVVSNAASRQGGGIYAYGTAVNDCRMEHNEAEDGGGAYLYFCPLRNSTFLDNMASPGFGGGAYVVGDEVTDCTFARNNGYWGGGLFLGAGEAHRVVAVSNLAARGGGLAAGESILEGLRLAQNSVVERGGGAYLQMCRMTDSVVSNNNLAWQDGIGGVAGGAGIAGEGCQFETCVIRDNWGYDADDQGGGIACFPVGAWTTEVVNCSIRGNSAGDGGGIFVATGALCVASATGTNATDIRQNAATNYGGGVCLTTQAVFRGSGNLLFAANEAAYGGGFAALEGAQATLEGADGNVPVFYDNTAADSGGGLYAAGTNTALTLRNVQVGRGGAKIQGNWARGTVSARGVGGGGIALKYGASLTGCNLRVEYNSCPSACGGGLLIDYSRAHIASTPSGPPATARSASLFANNSALAGGAIYSCASPFVIQEASFIENSAERGGAIFAYIGSTGRLDNVVMAGNVATVNGGGISIFDEGFPVTAVCDLRHCTLYGNGLDGVAAAGAVALSLTNCIVYGNAGTNVSPGCTVAYSDIQGGYAGAGNLDADPFFRDTARYDFHLTAASTNTVADAGIGAGLTNDCVFRARPLGAGCDLGAFEYNIGRDDSDGDGIPDEWELDHGLDPLNPADGPAHGDADGVPNDDEYLADTDPQDSDDYFRLTDCYYNPARPDRGILVGFNSSSNRLYTLYFTPALSNRCVWAALPGQINQQGVGSYDGLSDTNAPAAYTARTYRVTAAPIPE